MNNTAKKELSVVTQNSCQQPSSPSFSSSLANGLSCKQYVYKEVEHTKNLKDKHSRRMWSERGNVFVWSDLKICLICKIVLKSKFANFKNELQCLEDHLLSNKHKTSLISLFKACNYDPDHENLKLTYVANNSYIDCALFNYSSSFVYTENVGFHCTPCGYHICSPIEPDQVLADKIIDHLQDEGHFKKFKENIEWVCFLRSKNGYIQFNTNLIYCSECKQLLCSKDQALVSSTLIDHLENFHPNMWNCDDVDQSCEVDKTADNQNSSNPRSESYVTSHEFSSDSGSDTWFDTVQELERTDPDGDVDCCLGESIPCCNNTPTFAESSLIDIEPSWKTIPSVHQADECVGTQPDYENADDNLLDKCAQLQHKQHGVGTILHNITGHSNFDTIKDPACPECGEIIEVLNDDIDFSLQLHSRKHQVISDTFREFEMPNSSFNEDVDYVCPECDEVVTILNKDISLSFNHHYQEVHVNSKEMVTTQEKVVYNEQFVSDVFDCLPEALHKNRNYIVYERNSIHCKLCNCSVKTSKDIFSSSIFLIDHLTLTYHMDQYKAVTGDHNFNNMGLEEKLKTLFGREISFVEQHPVTVVKKSATKNGNNTSRDKDDKCQLIGHLASSGFSHEITVLDLDAKVNTCNIDLNNKVVAINALLNELPDNFKVHNDFLTVILSKINCSLCSVNFNADKIELKQHLTDISHRMRFLGELKKTLDVGQKCEMKFLIFMNGQLFCSLCKCYITPWSDFTGICHGVKSHFIIHPPVQVEKLEKENVAMNHEESERTNVYVSIGIREDEENKVNVLTVDRKQSVTSKIIPEVEDTYDSCLQHSPDTTNSPLNTTGNVSYSSNQETLASNFNAHFQGYAHKFLFQQENFKQANGLNEGNERMNGSGRSYAPEDLRETKHVVQNNMIYENLQTIKTTRINQKENELNVLSFDRKQSVTYQITPEVEDTNDSSLHHSPDTTNLALKHYRYGNAKVDSLNHIINLNKNESQNTTNQTLGASAINNKSSSVQSILSELENSVPLLNMNKKYLRRPDLNFFCSLCYRGICYSPNPKTLASNFNAHFQGNTHKYLLKQEKSQQANDTTVSDSTLLTHVVRLKMISKMNSAIRNNLTFIKNAGPRHYYCSICKEFILNSSSDEHLVNNFIEHFNENTHKYHFNRLKYE